MQVYTYSEARQKLARVLEQAESVGKVFIRRKDGRTFALVPEQLRSSPLDIPFMHFIEIIFTDTGYPLTSKNSPPTLQHRERNIL